MRQGILLLMLAVMPNVSVPQTATQPSSPWQDAYSRRNYQLGITISQFRVLPYPDQKEWPNAISCLHRRGARPSLPVPGTVVHIE